MHELNFKEAILTSPQNRDFRFGRALSTNRPEPGMAAKALDMGISGVGDTFRDKLNKSGQKDFPRYYGYFDPLHNSGGYDVTVSTIEDAMAGDNPHVAAQRAYTRMLKNDKFHQQASAENLNIKDFRQNTQLDPKTNKYQVTFYFQPNSGYKPPNHLVQQNTANPNTKV